MGVLDAFFITNPEAADISSANAGSVTNNSLPQASKLPCSFLVAEHQQAQQPHLPAPTAKVFQCVSHNNT